MFVFFNVLLIKFYLWHAMTGVLVDKASHLYIFFCTVPKMNNFAIIFRLQHQQTQMPSRPFKGGSFLFLKAHTHTQKSMMKICNMWSLFLLKMTRTRCVTKVQLARERNFLYCCYNVFDMRRTPITITNNKVQFFVLCVPVICFRYPPFHKNFVVVVTRTMSLMLL